MASVKNPSVKVFIKKNLPAALGGYQFYDKQLGKLRCVSPHKAWTALHQQFIDDFVNKACDKLFIKGFGGKTTNCLYSSGSERKWTGVPYLNPWDCPCTPGSVILVREWTLNKFVRRIPPHAYMAGLVTDFYSPDDIQMNALVPILEKPVRTAGTGREFRKVYQSKNTEAAVIITASGVSVSSVEHRLNDHPTFLDLDNFDETGLKPSSCYVITRVLTVDMLKIEVTLNGDVFYEHTFTVGVPICFHANKVHVDEDERLLKDMVTIKKRLPVQIMKKRTIQHFLNPFLPNQMKLGNAVGDAPAVYNWQEPNPQRSLRPNFLPRPERSHQTDVVMYFKNDQELIDAIYRTSGRRNPRTGPARPSCHHSHRPVARQPITEPQPPVENQPYDEIHDVEGNGEASSLTTDISTTSTRGGSSSGDVTSDDGSTSTRGGSSSSDVTSDDGSSDDETTSGEDSTTDDEFPDSLH